MTEPTEQQVKQRQRLTAVGLLAAIVLVVVCALCFSGSKEKPPLGTSTKTENIRIADASRAIRPEQEWISKSEVKLNQQSEQMTELTQKLEQLQKDQEALKIENENLKAQLESPGLPKNATLLGGELDAPTQTIEGPLGPTVNPGGAIFPVQHNNRNPHVAANNIPGSNPEGVMESVLTKHTIALTPPPKPKNTLFEKEINDYVPTGSYVKAVILSGVQASAAVRSQSDPLPILFRVTGPAITANHQEIDLTGCTVTGEAYGDISSERAFVRLHDMTCSRNEGKVIEAKVEGYAAALGTGIQGKVISREGALLKSSFFSGLFGGLGQATADASKTVSTNPLGTVESVKGDDILKNALGKGIASSADRISKYHIERAEQYHAVIEIKAGREVELVFIKGVHLDGRVPEKAQEKRDS